MRTMQGMQEADNSQSSTITYIFRDRGCRNCTLEGVILQYRDSIIQRPDQLAQRRLHSKRGVESCAACAFSQTTWRAFREDINGTSHKDRMLNCRADGHGRPRDQLVLLSQAATTALKLRDEAEKKVGVRSFSSAWENC